MTNPLYDTLFGKHAGSARTFLYLPDGGEVSYDAFLTRAARFANVLTSLGAQPGDRVAVQVAKSPDALALYAACVRAGLVFLPLNTAYTPGEVSYFVENSEARVFVCDPARTDDLRPVAKAAGATLETLGANGDGTLAEKADAAGEEFETVARTAGDLAAFLYTSGTTGRSKGAMLTQDNLLSNAEVLVDTWRFTADDVLLHALPIFHTHGLFVATNVILATGGALIFLPKLDVDRLIEFMPKATSLMGVPTFYTRLLDDARFTRELTEHMRLFTSGSAPLLAETHKVFEARTDHRILERYGMTETNMSTSNPYDGERRAGTVGFPLPGVELKITDPTTGETLPRGEIGVIEVRGRNVFKGYWRMPEKTREELREDGFFITGDLAQIDADGYVTIVGRNKDLIISGGYNVYPKEVELVLDAQPGVLESAVVGVPHPDFGESPVGVLVAEPGAEIDLAAVEAAMGRELARYKQPKSLVVIDELPRNTMGKVQKAALRERFAKTFGG
ncbi:malonate--CoA ligase [Tranquillimonas alkanivorans]|uniref:Malonyl-CoA/methylmalonyl-CoA synthetase n=1 Tax=Tranquillimonas alkanivorans TaxID=441119 RepID=A0A1I5NWM0_9RHOB|nr:malonyl-CoA synthase [Tranquillimonas alkanivorans]SFP26040.1 malonyl-CoA/methylmalonyl-CoA synthetase [Tranquillimonas alkanivorans]